MNSTWLTSRKRLLGDEGDGMNSSKSFRNYSKINRPKRLKGAGKIYFIKNYTAINQGNFVMYSVQILLLSFSA